MNAAGRLTGVLTGAIELKTLGESRQTRDLGFGGLTIVDRDGKLILGDLSPVVNSALLARIRHTGTGAFTNSPGLRGGSHHIVAFTTAAIPGWTIAIDRPASSVYAAARRSLIFELASIGAAVLAVLAILALVAKRSRREIEARGGQAQTWTRLTRRLAGAARPSDVADALLEAAESVFVDAVVVVVVDSETGEEVRAASNLPGWRRVPGDSERLRTMAALAVDGPGTRSLEGSQPARHLPDLPPQAQSDARLPDGRRRWLADRRHRDPDRAEPARRHRVGVARRVRLTGGPGAHPRSRLRARA